MRGGVVVRGGVVGVEVVVRGGEVGGAGVTVMPGSVVGGAELSAGAVTGAVTDAGGGAAEPTLEPSVPDPPTVAGLLVQPTAASSTAPASTVLVSGARRSLTK